MEVVEADVAVEFDAEVAVEVVLILVDVAVRIAEVDILGNTTPKHLVDACEDEQHVSVGFEPPEPQY